MPAQSRRTLSITLMGETEPLNGKLVSIAGGIEDRERSDTVGSLANVAPTFAWVRLPQRVPVRIAIADVPPGVRLIAGRTATVSVLSDRIEEKEDGLLGLIYPG